MKQAVSNILLLLLFLTSAGSISAQTAIIELPVYRSAGQLWLDENNKLQGFRVKVLDELNRVLEKDKIQLKYRLTGAGEIPIKRCINGILKGSYDAYFGLIHSKERKHLGLKYSRTEIYSIPTVVWMNRNNQFDYTGPESFKGKRIGVVLGYPYLQDINTSDFVIEAPDNDESNVKLLERGRVDAVIDNIVRTGTVIVGLGFSDKITYAARPFSISKFYIAYNKNVPEHVINKIDAALTKLHHSGFIKKILDDNVYNPIAK